MIMNAVFFRLVLPLYQGVEKFAYIKYIFYKVKELKNQSHMYIVDMTLFFT